MLCTQSLASISFFEGKINCRISKTSVMDASEIEKENNVRKDLRDSIIWTVIGLLILFLLGYAFKVALVSHSI